MGIDLHHLAKKVVDFESGLEELKIPTLYKHFSNSLEVGRSARLLETIRGYGELSKPMLYDYASQFGYNPEYVNKILIPRYEDWGLITNDDKSIDIKVKTQKDILTKCGDSWLKNKIDESRDSLAIELILETSKIPRDEEKLKENIYARYDNDVVVETTLTLETLNQFNSYKIGDKTFRYNPDVFGDNIQNIGKFITTIPDKDINTIGDAYSEVFQYQGYPNRNLVNKFSNADSGVNLMSLLVSGVFNPCDVTIGHNNHRFLFTGDVLSSKSKHCDDFHTIKETVCHFRYAEHYAEYHLWSLEKFLGALLRDGEAGRASPIQTDYIPLITKGIIQIAPLGTSQKYRMYLVDGKKDILEQTLDIISSGTKLETLPKSRSIQTELERLKSPPEARASIDHVKLSDLTKKLMTSLQKM